MIERFREFCATIWIANRILFSLYILSDEGQFVEWNSAVHEKSVYQDFVELRMVVDLKTSNVVFTCSM